MDEKIIEKLAQEVYTLRSLAEPKQSITREDCERFLDSLTLSKRELKRKKFRNK